jgi:aryl-alcohol dehydrogenase
LPRPTKSARSSQPYQGLVTVDPELPLELLGPLACGLSTGAGAVLNALRPHPGASVVVFGVGSVGLAAVMAARNSGATRIIAVDRHESRLAIAHRLGVTDTINTADTDPVAAVQDIFAGPADFSLECTGISARSAGRPWTRSACAARAP